MLTIVALKQVLELDLASISYLQKLQMCSLFPIFHFIIKLIKGYLMQSTAPKAFFIMAHIFYNHELVN